MKCIKLREAEIDICVTIKVKPIFMEKTGGALEQELERLEVAHVLKYLGAGHEEGVAREIARQFEQRKERL